jgi:hypothetical protein
MRSSLAAWVVLLVVDTGSAASMVLLVVDTGRSASMVLLVVDTGGAATSVAGAGGCTDRPAALLQASRAAATPRPNRARNRLLPNGA